ncbi:alpha/beta hydrolase [Qipengyuania gaetbuli]|uniref:alpha/beta hydrolase n=1 Tax=Qipengyuania gaetbuli TaxID=266952 RepID=UPI001C9949BD|nr:alpha/beta hydrolase [Qipengyuania gaetbuli]MBY6015715.1 alpha/beta hydrolase [Qipengyuania gaetbuli]
MLRAVLLLLATLATGIASPVAAQSMGLVKLPIAFVRQPVVQQVHAGRPIPAIEAPRAPVSVTVQTIVYAPVPAPPQFVPRPVQRPTYSAVRARFAGIDRSLRNYSAGIAQYGPFRVLDEGRVALVGETDADSPRWFRVMMRRHPNLAQLDMVECPGTSDDLANMKLGRMIRTAGLATYVPRRGSVRSGAVELFLAGAARDIADGAEFAVHSWMDEHGHEAQDYEEDAPENRRYLTYYREMGMSERDARAFYRFTNSVPHRSARWLDAREMRRWVGGGAGAGERAPQIAHAAY